jgi:hypothetical protein
LVYSGDVQSTCRGLVLLAVLSAVAPGAQGAQDVWRGLRWDMSMDRASQTLSRQGLKVREQARRKSPTTWFSTEVDGREVTVYFDEDGRMSQITVIAGTLTREAVSAAKERLTKRFGAVKETSSRAERMWGQRFGANGPWATLFVGRIPEEGWIAREEYGLGKASGPAGVFDLTWGQAAPDVERHLRAAGFEARTTGMLIDPCRMPNPPPLCEPDANVTVRFHKGLDEGIADVHKKRGLVQITFTARVASYAEGLNRAKPIEALHGPASEIEDATITTWGDATANVSLDVRENKPKGTLSAIETYSPPGKER